MKPLAERAEEAKTTGRLELTPAEFGTVQDLRYDIPPELGCLAGWAGPVEVVIVWPAALSDALERVLEVLATTRFVWTTEEDLQTGIAQAMLASGLPVLSEVRFGPHSRIDLMVGKVGIEVKIDGDWRAVRRQVERYCLLAGIDAVVVATSKVAHATGIPSTLNGKPVRVHLVGSTL